MELYPPLELDRSSTFDRVKDRGSASPVTHLIELSSWMMVLGTIRVVCMVADYAGSFFEKVRVEPVTMRMLGRLTDEIHPVLALGSAWPLILALALRRTRWPQLLPAAAATFLILSIGGGIELAVQLGHLRGFGGVVGSFHVTRRAFLNPTITDFSLITLGVIQLTFELATAVRTIVLIARFRGTSNATDIKADRGRSSRYGRIALYISVGFLFLMVRQPVWSTYLELLNNSRLVRDFVMRSERQQSGRLRFGPSYSAPATEEEKRFGGLRSMATLAAQETQMGRYMEAKDRYLRVIAMLDPSPEDSLPQNGRPLLALALNNLAWMEATCPQTAFRNPTAAVRHARRATVVQPEDGNYWNTLGAAHYRAGEWEDAKTALGRSMALRRQGDAFDWFFVALVELKRGQKTDARQWYDRAVQWYQKSAPFDNELYRFHVEAAEELGLPKPDAPASASIPQVVVPSLNPTRRVLRRRDAEDRIKANRESAKARPSSG